MKKPKPHTFAQLSLLHTVGAVVLGIGGLFVLFVLQLIGGDCPPSAGMCLRAPDLVSLVLLAIGGVALYGAKLLWDKRFEQ